MNKFIIACLPRTGSYRLVDILNQQEGVVCHGEVFKKTGIELNDEYLKEVSLTEEDIKRRDADPASFMGELFGAAEKKNNIASGFKIFPRHNKEALEYCVAEEGFSVIFLCRNPFQQYVSLKVARNTGLWVKKARGRKRKEVAPISFDKKDFIDKMNVIFSYYNKVRLLSEMSGKKVLEIDYYDSLTREGVSSVMDHIGAPQPMGEEDVATSHKKVIKKDYAEVVENWGEARDFLDMLDVDENMGFFDFYKKVMGRLDLAS